MQENQGPYINREELQGAVGRVMGVEQQSQEQPNPFQDPLLRREAGEGLLGDKPNKIVLGAIVAREAIGKELENATDNEEREAILAEYADMREHVEKLKRQFGITSDEEA